MDSKILANDDKSNCNNCIGIIRESKYTWERRVALTPKNCQKLISEGIKVLVQPCKIRCYTDEEYLEVGAQISEDLSPCKIILGIQDIPINNLLKDKTYLSFSHALKGQPDKAELIKKIKELNIRLIDYEAIREESNCKHWGKRLVSFGRIAGVAGTLNIFNLIGQLLLARKISNQFLFTKLGYMHCNLEEAFDSIKKLGEYISEQYLPNEICPFIIGVLGSGQVGTGVIEALKFLPHKMISPKDLRENNYERKRDMVYIVVFNSEDLFETKKTGQFNWAEFTEDPEKFVSKFTETSLEKISLLINCLYWEKRFPRIISKEQLKTLFFNKNPKLLGISDISCDINGSIEILEEYNSNKRPFFIYEPLQMINVNLVDDSSPKGIMFTAIPYLAASFSYDASEYFSDLLFPFLKELVKSKYPLDEPNDFAFSKVLDNAIITSKGKLVNYTFSLTYGQEKQATNINKNKIVIDLESNTLKLVGHLLDRKIYNNISILLLKYNLEFEVLYSKIGWLEEDYSTVYLSISNKDQEKYQKCFEEISDIAKKSECVLKVVN